MDYEGQICRAPMERASFMLPVMVGCSYNRCKFCNLFRHLKYRVLPEEQVEAELKRVKDAGGKPRKIFLGDGNAFGLKTEYLLEILGLIHRYFPECACINMDATITSIRQKSDSGLHTLSENGVRHLYIGIESGLDDVLVFMEKDHNLAQAYEGISRLQAAGLVFDAHIMTGVAGHGRGMENAEALADFFRRTGPSHVVNFSMFLHKETALYQDIRNGRFTPASELENLKEERRLVELLGQGAAEMKYDGFHDYIAVRTRGTLPKDKEKMLAKLDAAAAENEGMEPVYAYVCGTCPELGRCGDGSGVWDIAHAAQGA